MMHIHDLQRLSHNGQVYRSFGMAIVADYGLLAMMPLTEVEGRLLDVIDGCPVQWQEAFAVLSVQADESLATLRALLNERTQQLLAEFSSSSDALPCEWRCARDPQWGTFVFAHASGLRMALDPCRALTSEAFDQQRRV